MKNTSTPERAFQQVSLPRAFVHELNSAADAAGRSAAKQLEHSFRIALAIEQFLPGQTVQALKAGLLPAAELLNGLAALLSNPAASPALNQVLQENPVRISVDLSDPSVFIRTNEDGTKDRGTLGPNGQFIPQPAISQGVTAKHEPLKRTSASSERRIQRESQERSGRSRKMLATAD